MLKSPHSMGEIRQWCYNPLPMVICCSEWDYQQSKTNTDPLEVVELVAKVSWQTRPNGKCRTDSANTMSSLKAVLTCETIVFPSSLNFAIARCLTVLEILLTLAGMPTLPWSIVHLTVKHQLDVQTMHGVSSSASISFALMESWLSTYLVVM